jgi:outer membrane protein TolC
MIQKAEKTNIGRSACYFLLVVFLAACKHYEPNPVDLDKTLATIRSKSLSDTELLSYLSKTGISSPGSGPSPAWSLDALTHVAYFYNPELALAETEISFAEAGLELAQQRPNPTLMAQPAYNGTTSIPTPWILGGNINLPIETAEKRSIRTSVATHRKRVTQFNLAAKAWQVRTLVRSAFVDLWSATSEEAAAKNFLSATTKIYRLQSSLLTVGEVSGLEMQGAAAEMERARMTQLLAANKLQAGKSNLARALGLSMHELENINFDFHVLEEELHLPPDQEQQDAALTNRADLLANLAEHAALEEELRLEIARQYPDISLNPGMNYNQGDREWRLGLKMELPLFHQNQGAIAQAEVRRRAQAERCLVLQTQILNQIETTVLNYNNAMDRFAAADAALDSANEIVQFTKSNHAAGISSLLDVAVAESAQAQSSIGKAQAAATLQKAVTELEFAIQLPVNITAAVNQETHP